jgi:hypothetical protein
MLKKYNIIITPGHALPRMTRALAGFLGQRRNFPVISLYYPWGIMIFPPVKFFGVRHKLEGSYEKAQDAPAGTGDPNFYAWHIPRPGRCL